MISHSAHIVPCVGLRDTDRQTAFVFAGLGMHSQGGEYDYHRYRQLLAEAIDESKRLALIALLIEERARDRLAAERASARAAMTAMTVAKVLGSSPPDRVTATMRFNLVSLRSVKDAR